MGQEPSADTQRDPFPVRAKHPLRVRGVWVIPVLVGSVVRVLMTAFYFGSVVDPLGHLRGLPVSTVNEDAGAALGARRLDFGAQMQSALSASRVSQLLSLEPEGLAAAERRMNRRCLRQPGHPARVHGVVALARGAAAAGGSTSQQAER